MVLISPTGDSAFPWTKKSPPNRIERSHLLLGETVDQQKVYDFLSAVKYLKGDWSLKRLRVGGSGRDGILAAYAALLDPTIAEVVLVLPPTSHMQGPHFPGILRTVDIPRRSACSRRGRSRSSATIRRSIARRRFIGWRGQRRSCGGCRRSDVAAIWPRACPGTGCDAAWVATSTGTGRVAVRDGRRRVDDRPGQARDYMEIPIIASATPDQAGSPSASRSARSRRGIGLSRPDSRPSATRSG